MPHLALKRRGLAPDGCKKRLRPRGKLGRRPDSVLRIKNTPDLLQSGVAEAKHDLASLPPAWIRSAHPFGAACGCLPSPCSGFHDGCCVLAYPGDGGTNGWQLLKQAQRTVRSHAPAHALPAPSSPFPPKKDARHLVRIHTTYSSELQ